MVIIVLGVKIFSNCFSLCLLKNYRFVLLVGNYFNNIFSGISPNYAILGEMTFICSAFQPIFSIIEDYIFRIFS